MGEVDPDPDPRIHLSVIVDPNPWIHIWKKWIRIRFQSGSGSGSEYLFFIKKFMSDKFKCLFLLPPFRKDISQIAKTFSFTFTLHSFGLFWCYPDSNQCFKLIRIREKKSSGSGPGFGSGARIELDPDPNQKRCFQVCRK